MKKIRVLLMLLVSGAAMIAQTPKKSPSVRAEIEVNTLTTLNDGNQLQKTVTQRFYRDSQGRMRMENGNTVTINDVVAHQILVLNLANHTAQRIPAPASALVQPRVGALQRSPLVNANTSQAQTPDGVNLGSRNINGFDTDGKLMVSTIPANSSLGNKLPIQRTTRIWKSPALNLPLLVEIDDSVHGHITMQYKNLQAGVLLDPILFEVPPEFTVIERTGATRPAASGQFPKP
jgi:outer membrane lipoprotein-sorting protein